MRALYSALLLVVVVLACLSQPPGLPEPQSVQVDTTALIVRVFNYHPRSVRAFLVSLPDSNRSKVGDVSPSHEGFFIIPSREIVGLVLFNIVVIPADTTLQPYRAGPITRNSAKITLVYVVVGQLPGDSVRVPTRS